MFVLQDNEAPYVMIRTVSRSAHWVCVYGAHELCIARHDDATLCFTRWSNSEQRGKRLAILKFDLYEGMIMVSFSQPFSADTDSPLRAGSLLQHVPLFEVEKHSDGGLSPQRIDAQGGR